MEKPVELEYLLRFSPITKCPFCRPDDIHSVGLYGYHMKLITLRVFLFLSVSVCFQFCFSFKIAETTKLQSHAEIESCLGLTLCLLEGDVTSFSIQKHQKTKGGPLGGKMFFLQPRKSNGLS